MKFIEYGNRDGKAVIYFHGVPGSPAEAVVLNEPARRHGLSILCPDRFTLPPALSGDAYYQHIAEGIRTRTVGAPIAVVGFSIGCHLAIEVSLRLGAQITALHLISAAAPLQGGNFIELMAGKTVFSLANRHPTLFRTLSRWQAFLARRAPGLLFGMLFASAQGKDRELRNEPAFKQQVSGLMRACFDQGIDGYTRDIALYLKPWQQSVANCRADTQLWHGTDDNWSPPAMAHYLKQTLPGPTALHLLPGLSHYSCLTHAAPRICQSLSRN